MEHAVVCPIGEADVRSGVKPGPIAGDDPDNVAAFQRRLDAGDPVLWNLVEWPLANSGFHLAQRSEQGWICL